MQQEHARSIKNAITLKVECLVQQDLPVVPIRKYLGFVNAKGILNLLGVAELLTPNPRRPRRNDATQGIENTLEYDSEFLYCKSKGLLISCSVVEKLERNRLRLSFDSKCRTCEGVLDGGHNLFAISCFVISRLGEDDANLGNVVRSNRDWNKDWSGLCDFWQQNSDMVFSAFDRNNIDFSFLVPIEILTVGEMNESNLAVFQDKIPDISEARNNNQQLSDLAAANQRGYFDIIKDALPEYLRNQVQWTTGVSNKPVKGEYVLALSALLFKLLCESEKCPNIFPSTFTPIAPSVFYSGRARCVDQAKEVLRRVNELKENDPGNSEVAVFKESMGLLKDFPRICDIIEQNFPNLYNKFGGRNGSGSGSYGNLRPFAAKTNQGKNARLAHDKPCRYHTPNCIMKAETFETLDGYVAPLKYSVLSFIAFDNDKNRLTWVCSVDSIIKFYSSTDENAPIAKTIKLVGSFIGELANGDPQKMGKTPLVYEQVMQNIKIARIEFGLGK